MKIKFPVIDEEMYWRPPTKKGKCVLCGCRPKDGVFIAVDGGALVGTKHNAKMSDKLIGFLHIMIHDHNRTKGKWGIEVVDSSKNGQFEFYFCSSKCMRKFFNAMVDEFERVTEL